MISTTQKRLELSTSAVTGRRSNQLSHWAITKVYTFKTAYTKHKNLFSYPPFALPCLGQALDRLVAVSSIHCCTSTSALSTSSSSRGLTSL